MKKAAVGWILLQLFCMMLCRAGCESSFQLVFEGDIIGFRDNEITIEASEQGQVSISLFQGERLVRQLNGEVQKGKCSLNWDGLGPWQEILDSGPIRAEGTLTGVSGNCYSLEGSGYVGKPEQHLLYVLPTHRTLMSGESVWVETALAKSGKVIMEVFDASGKRVAKTEKKIAGQAVGRIEWNGKSGKKQLPDGEYHLRIYPNGAETEAVTVELQITSVKNASDKIEETGHLFEPLPVPEDISWDQLMAGSVVADVPYTQKQVIRKEASSGSRVVGRISGQTQAVEVVRVDGKWAEVRARNLEDGRLVTGFIPVKRLKKVNPDGEFALIVDKGRQRLLILREGELLGTMPVSTGLASESSALRETPSGWYFTGLHSGDETAGGYRYDCLVQFNTEKSIRRLGYTMSGKSRDYTVQSAEIGSRYGSGDILLPDIMDGNLNAYWIWTHIPAGTRLLILEGISESSGSEDEGADVVSNAEPALLTVPESGPEFDQEVGITLMGSFSFSSTELDYVLGMKDFFSEDDATLCMLNTIVTDRMLTMAEENAVSVGTDLLKTLSGASVEAVALTTEHYTDDQGEGRMYTRMSLKNAGIKFVGDGNSLAVGWPHRIGMTGFRQEEYEQNSSICETRIQEIQGKNCEAVICFLYWEDELKRKEMVNAAVSAGCSMVVCCGRDETLGVDMKNGVPVLLGPGGFLWSENAALIYRISFRFIDRAFAGILISPYVVKREGGQVLFCTEEETEQMLSEMERTGMVHLQAHMYFAK